MIDLNRNSQDYPSFIKFRTILSFTTPKDCPEIIHEQFCYRVLEASHCYNNAQAALAAKSIMMANSESVGF